LDFVGGWADYKQRYEASLLQVGDLQGKVMELIHQLDQLKKMIFGSRSECYVLANPNAVQYALFNQDLEGASYSVIDTQKISYIKTKVVSSESKVHAGRMKLAPHLRRKTSIIEPEEDVSAGKKIGEEITEILNGNPENCLSIA
jgi:hypothetical protein